VEFSRQTRIKEAAVSEIQKIINIHALIFQIVAPATYSKQLLMRIYGHFPSQQHKSP
jgi:hypothetical protein